jgi:hypothetical protein
MGRSKHQKRVWNVFESIGIQITKEGGDVARDAIPYNNKAQHHFVGLPFLQTAVKLRLLGFRVLQRFSKVMGMHDFFFGVSIFRQLR